MADEMNITQLSATGNGFTAKRVDGNGKEGTTEFEFGGADEEYALYTKVGDLTHDWCLNDDGMMMA